MMAFLVSAIEGLSKELQNGDSTWVEQGTTKMAATEGWGEESVFICIVSGRILVENGATRSRRQDAASGNVCSNGQFV